MGSETLPSACYTLSDESSIPFYSTSNGYKKKFKEKRLKGNPSPRINTEKKGRPQFKNKERRKTRRYEKRKDDPKQDHHSRKGRPQQDQKTSRTKIRRTIRERYYLFFYYY